jgi:hypothetical protein
MDEVTARNARGQLVGSGVWVQVAEIFKAGQEFKSEKYKEKNPTDAAHERGTENRPGV